MSYHQGGYNGSGYGQQAYAGGGSYPGYEQQQYGGYHGGGGGGQQGSTQVQVPQNKVGRVIGKGGSKIREIQEMSGAGVKILKDQMSSDGMVACELTGTEDCMCEAKRLIDECCQDSGFGGGYGRGGGGGGGFGGGFGGGSRESSTIFIEPKDVGKVIGRGGSNIRSLQENTCCRINVRQNDADKNISGGRIPVELTGELNARSEAESAIKELVAQDSASYGGASW